MGMELSEKTRKDILNTFKEFKGLGRVHDLSMYHMEAIVDLINYFQTNFDEFFAALSFSNDYITEFLSSLDSFVSGFAAENHANNGHLAFRVFYRSAMICFELSMSFRNPVLDNVILKFKNENFGDGVESVYKNIFDVNSYKIISYYIKASKDKDQREVDDRLERIKENIAAVREIEASIKNSFKNLDSIQKGQNFVKLSHGFLKLKNEKSRSASVVKRGMYLTILLIPTLVIVAMFFNSLFIFDGILNHSHGWYIVSSISLFMTSLVFVSLYFYRMQLQEYKSIKAQESQLELRIALCGFVENYAKFKKDIKDNTEKNLLDKFDNIIFSGLVLDESQVPTAYDGLAPLIEAIGKVIPKSYRQ